MKRFLLLFFIGASLISSNAQIVINSQFKPFTYDEMAAPLRAVQQFHNQSLNTLGNLMEDLETLESYISKQNDPTCWRIYTDCYNSMVDTYNNIQDNGTNQRTRGRINELRKYASSTKNRIINAVNRRNQLSSDQYNRLRSVSGLTCDRFYSDMSLDDFLDGSTPYVQYSNR